MIAKLGASDGSKHSSKFQDQLRHNTILKREDSAAKMYDTPTGIALGDRALSLASLSPNKRMCNRICASIYNGVLDCRRSPTGRHIARKIIIMKNVRGTVDKKPLNSRTS